MTPLDRLLLIRQGGAVERAHTTPHHGSYSVAAHSWGVAAIILTFVASPRPALIRAALFHDVPERWTGDLPAQLLWSDKEFATRLDALDAKILGLLEIGYVLTPEEATWLALADTLDLLLWAFDQVALGNRSAEKMIDRIRASLRERHREGKLTPEMSRIVADIFERREKGWELDSDLP